MKKILAIVTRANDPAVQEMIVAQAEIESVKLTIADLTEADPDYNELLDQLFAADAVQVF